MNSNHLLQVLQKGFHVSLGATSALVETLQDPQKREQNLSQLKSELSERLQEWEQKGLITEQEARNFVDSVLRQDHNREGSSPAETPSDTVARTPTPTAPPEVQLEMQELTAQIAAIRAELEKRRESGLGA